MSARPVTSYDVAARAGVSQSTISRALRGDVRVAVPTRDRISAIAAEMGYVPHLMARSLITRKSSSFAIVSGDLRNPSYPLLIATLQEEFAAHGYRTLLMSDAEGGADGRHSSDVQALRGGLVDGVVCISAGVTSPIVAELAQWGVPLVVLNRVSATVTEADVDSITSDNARGGRLVAEHLHGLGHRRIGMVSGPWDNPSVRNREEGFRAALAELGSPVPEELVRRGPVAPTTGLTAGGELLGLEHPPTAVFCVTDYIALGFMDAAKRGGLDVPADVQVVGYNDLDWAGWSMFDLTTVRQPFAEMARRAATTLLARVSGDESPVAHEVWDVELVPRGTTRPLQRNPR